MSAREFIDMLVNEVPTFDEMIMESIRPTDGWIGNISYGPFAPDWFDTREAVRKLSEGIAFKPSKRQEPIGFPDRFREVYPDTKEAWKCSVS